MFYVGQKVECLRANWTFPVTQPSILFPVCGTLYVIRSIRTRSHQAPGLRFHGLTNPAMQFRDGIIEPSFATHHPDGSPNFRPLVETDISIFTAMLTPARESIDA